MLEVIANTWPCPKSAIAYLNIFYMLYSYRAPHFYADVAVSVSTTFFGWVFGFAGKIEIIAPDDVVQEYITNKSL